MRYLFVALLPVCAAVGAWLGARGDDDARLTVLDERQGSVRVQLRDISTSGVLSDDGDVVATVVDEEALAPLGLTTDDLPLSLADHAEVDLIDDATLLGGPALDGAFLLATDWDVQLTIGAADGDLPWARAGEPPDGTLNVFATVLVAVDQVAAVRSFDAMQSASSDGRDNRVTLRPFNDGTLDEADLLADHANTYADRGRQSLDVSGLGDHAFGERYSTAVLDYDRERNQYRSERELYREHAESISFVVGRRLVMLTRTSVSCCSEVPDDMDIVALAETIRGRLAALDR